MIVERLIRHFRANEYSDSCKRKIDAFYTDLCVLHLEDLRGEYRLRFVRKTLLLKNNDTFKSIDLYIKKQQHRTRYN